MTDSALERARREVATARIDFTALHRDALGDPPPSYVVRIRNAWVKVENAIARLEAVAKEDAAVILLQSRLDEARLAGRLEQAERTIKLISGARDYCAHKELFEERDRLRAEVEK